MQARTLSPGQVLGGYRVEVALGRGGMGEVWSAQDLALGRRVAIKVLRGAEGADAAVRERFVREGRAAAALVHPAVVTVFAAGETDGVAWLAMELVEGRTLRAVSGAASLDTKVAWLASLAAGLDAVHRAGFVHRDVKPDNVMITHDGRLKLLDFGLVRPPAGAASLTATGYVMGTPRYMAPEQWRNEAMDARLDQFAWGLVAFELLSGRHPDDCSVGFGRLASWGAAARPLTSMVPAVHPDVGYLVDRALAVRPDDRFASMHEIATALAALAAAVASGPRIAPAGSTRTLVDAPRAEAPAGSPRVLVFLAGFGAVLLFALCALGLVLVFGDRASGARVPPPPTATAPSPPPSVTPTPALVATAPGASPPTPGGTTTSSATKAAPPRIAPTRSAGPAPSSAPAPSSTPQSACVPFTTLEVSAGDFVETVPGPALAAWERAIREPLAACYRATARPACAGTNATIGIRLYKAGPRFDGSGIGVNSWGDSDLPSAKCLFAAVDHEVPRSTVETTFHTLRLELR